MNLVRILDQTPQTDYAKAVDFLLERCYGTTIAARFAERWVEAARHAGYSPSECADWLAEVEGLR